MSTRARLREGFLARLAGSQDAEAFALRGGMLVQSWAPLRSVRDVDLVCRLPDQPRAMAPRFRAILGRSLDDGIAFDADRFRIDAVGPHDLQLFAAGSVDGVPGEITVDVVFRLEVWPAARRAHVAGVELWTCPHEMVIATKLAVIAELGPVEWRTKDLADIWLLLRRFPPASVLGETLERLCEPARALLTSAWWREPRAAMRWARQVARDPSVPPDLAAVVAEVRAQLSPFARVA